MTVVSPKTEFRPTNTGRARVNGVDYYYYEIHGKGEPMLLLHGGLDSIDMFAPVLPTFANSRTVLPFINGVSNASSWADLVDANA